LAIIEKKVGPNHLETTAFINNLALLYQNKENTQGRATLSKGTGDHRKNLGAEHPVTAALLAI